MKHEKYKELLELNILGELTENEEIELKNHLFECNECNEEYANLKKIYSVITTERPEFPTEEELLNSRKRLFNTISAEQLISSEKPKNIWSKIFSNNYSFAFGSIVLLLVGFFVGYLLFNNSDTAPKLMADNIIDLDKLESGDLKIAKVSFPDKFSENSKFEFKLANGRLSSYQGSLNDAVVQKLLAVAFNETENPGFKIRTAKTFAEDMPKNFIPDEKIKDAFIHSLITDENPGVRKGALKALINFSYDNKIENALLYTLENDENASNRMDAINALLTMNFGANAINENIKYQLTNGIKNEENEVIKNKTAKLLIGGK